MSTQGAELFLEEEITKSLTYSFGQKFDLDSKSAMRIAIEVLEVLTLSESNLDRLNEYYLN